MSGTLLLRAGLLFTGADEVESGWLLARGGVITEVGSGPKPAADDVVEVPCLASRGGIAPQPAGTLPDAVQGLVLAVKAYERTAIQAAVEGSSERAQTALLQYPPVGEWEPAGKVLQALIESDPEHLGYLRNPIAVS